MSIDPGPSINKRACSQGPLRLDCFAICRACGQSEGGSSRVTPIDCQMLLSSRVLCVPNASIAASDRPDFPTILSLPSGKRLQKAVENHHASG